MYHWVTDHNGGVTLPDPPWLCILNLSNIFMSFVLFWNKNIQQIVYLINLHKITENTSFPTPAQHLGVTMSPCPPRPPCYIR